MGIEEGEGEQHMGLNDGDHSLIPLNKKHTKTQHTIFPD